MGPMNLGPYRLRLPWVKMVTMPIEQEIYMAVRQSILEDLLEEIGEAASRLMTDEPLQGKRHRRV